MKRAAKALARRGGIDVRRHVPERSADWRRNRVLERLGIDLVLDVGGNVGRWAAAVRGGGYAGRIVSFEPHPEVFAELEARAARDPLWEARRVALGAADGQADLHLGGASVTSSLLEVLPQLELVPDWRVVGSERVPAARLDTLAGELLGGAARVFAKLDVQGAELDVLAGGERTFASVVAIEVELQLQQHYRGQPQPHVLLRHLDDLGFRLVGLAEGWASPETAEMSYADALLVRR